MNSWPFNKIPREIQNTLDFWVKNVADKTIPIRLTKKHYDALMETLPRSWPRIGKPRYKGYEIERGLT